MSSILNALKRVETDGSGDPSIHSHPPPWLLREDVRATWSDRCREVLITSGRRWMAAGMILVATVTAAALVGSMIPVFFQTLGHQPPTTTIVPSRTTVPAAKTVPANHPTTPFNEPSAVTSPPPEVEQPDTLATAGSEALPATGGIVAEHLPPKTGARPSAVVIDGPQPPSPPPGAIDHRPVYENVGKPADPPVAIPLPAEAGLSLQAVSWSENAHRRIAVINSRILHDGETIAGYTVSRIDPESVNLVRRGATYRIIFRPR